MLPAGERITFWVAIRSFDLLELCLIDGYLLIDLQIILKIFLQKEKIIKMNYTKNTNIIQKPSLKVIKTNTKKKKKESTPPQ